MMAAAMRILKLMQLLRWLAGEPKARAQSAADLPGTTTLALDWPTDRNEVANSYHGASSSFTIM
jgi:hypothetical protein